MTTEGPRRMWAALELLDHQIVDCNGQLAGINDYKDGVKHGLEASWNENGELNYERTFEDGKIVKSR